MVSEICVILKKTFGRGCDDPGTQLLRHLICLFTLIINIYSLGVGISTIIKFTSGRGWGMTTRAWAIRHLICLVTLIINIYGLRVGISTIKKFTSGKGWGMTPRCLSYKAFNLPSHPDHKYIWLRVGISITFFNRFPSGVGLSPGDKKCWMHNFTLASPPIPNIKFLSFVVWEKCVILKICTFSIKKHDFTRKKTID
jgi:hypothetical protein